MIARITDNKFIRLEQITQGIEEILVERYSVKHPRSHYIDTNAHWDGWYRRYSVSKQLLALPFLNDLIICCDKADIPLEISDERDAPKFPVPLKEQITEKFIEDITLFDHQVRALHSTCDDEIGMFDMTTGAGKTEVMCGIIKMFRCPTLIITEQIVVLEQIVERLKLRKVVHNDDIGKFCHGERPNGNIVAVGSIQSLNMPTKPSKKIKTCTTKQAHTEGIKLAKSESEDLNFLPEKLKESLYKNPNDIKKLKGNFLAALKKHVSKMFHERNVNWYKVRSKNAAELQLMAKKCDLLLVDECDKAAGSGYDQLFKKIFTGRRRYGFSGTPFDSDKPVESLMLRERLGSVIEKASRKELTKIGQIIPISYNMFQVGDPSNKGDSTTLDIAEREQIIENELFHKLVKKIIDAFPDEATMILVDTWSIEDMGLFLEQEIPDSIFIYNKTTKKKRREAIQNFEDRKIKVLIGGKILKRGLDLSGGVHNLILIGGGKLESNLDQMIGRAVRKNNKGFARVFDFLFLNNKYLYAHSRARLKTAVKMGYPTKVIAGGQEISGKKFVKSRFRIPKPKV